MNNACKSHYSSNSSFSLKELNLKCFGGQQHSLSLFTSTKGRLHGDIIKRTGWVIGILLSIALPFFRFKWGSLLQIKNKVEDVIETIEEVVDGVEMMAEKIDEVAEHIGSVLPESQLKNVLKAVEDFSEDTAEVAHAAGDFIDQIQGEDVELVEEVDLPKEQLKDLLEKTAKVAHSAEDLKDKVQEVGLKAEEISEKKLVESVKEEANKSL
uniref:Plastid-targeted protein 2 n=1 Tax=Solanum tuberosum TaxID=4113 RepID=M1D1H9_SOLTU